MAWKTCTKPNRTYPNVSWYFSGWDVLGWTTGTVIIELGNKRSLSRTNKYPRFIFASKLLCYQNFFETKIHINKFSTNFIDTLLRHSSGCWESARQNLTAQTKTGTNLFRKGDEFNENRIRSRGRSPRDQIRFSSTSLSFGRRLLRFFDCQSPKPVDFLAGRLQSRGGRDSLLKPSRPQESKTHCGLLIWRWQLWSVALLCEPNMIQISWPGSHVNGMGCMVCSSYSV